MPIYRFTLQPEQTLPKQIAGRFLQYVEGTAPIEIRKDGADWATYWPGTGTGRGRESFAWFELRNPQAVDLIVFIWADLEEFIDQRRYQYPAPTRFVVNPATTIAAGETVQLPATWAIPDRIRKAIIVQNLDAALSLQIRVGTAVVNEVPGSPIPITHTFEISGPCNVHNPHGAAIQCRISEIVVTD